MQGSSTLIPTERISTTGSAVDGKKDRTIAEDGFCRDSFLSGLAE
jgi:hypothetical protein